MTDDNSTSGNFVRYAEPSAASEPGPLSAPYQPNRVDTGTLRHTAGGNIEESGRATYTATQDGAEGGSVVATLRRYGPTQSVELEPGNPASRTSVAVALQQGLIRRNAAGEFEDASRALGQPGADAPAVAPEAKPETAPRDPGAEVFDADDDAVWAKVIDPLPQLAYDASVASVILATMRGADLSSPAESLAKTVGMEPGQAREFVETGAAMYERVVARAVAQVGVGEDQKHAFYTYCRQKQGFQNALQKLAYERDPGAFQALAIEFLRHQPAK